MLFRKLCFVAVAISLASAVAGYDAVAFLGDSIAVGINADQGSCSISAERNNLAFPAEFKRLYDQANPGNNLVVTEFGTSGDNLVQHLVPQTTLFGAWATNVAVNQSIQLVVFLGHNDLCRGQFSKNAGNCASDAQYGLYCRSKYSAVQSAVTTALNDVQSLNDNRAADAQISVLFLSPIRVPQLCNFKNKDPQPSSLSFYNDLSTCEALWEYGPRNLFDNIFLPESDGICGSVTGDERYWWGGIKDPGCGSKKTGRAYQYQKTFIDTVKAAQAPYSFSSVSDIAWNSPIATEDMVSSCDCFHPASVGQTQLASWLLNGRDCADGVGCCQETTSTSFGTLDTYARCLSTTRIHTGSYPSILA